MTEYWPTVLIMLKLLMAIVCGGLIGFEREIRRKAAGLRTNVLICLGAALYMIVSRHISGGAAFTDPARLAAQVVTGIGFIGAGVILQSRGSITGLTTAATIFVVAAVGIAIGEGMFIIALLATLLIIMVLVLLSKLEWFIRRHRLFYYSVRTEDPAEFLEQLLELLKQHRLRLEDFEVRQQRDSAHEVRLSVFSSMSDHQKILKRLPKIGKELRTTTREQDDYPQG